MEQEGKIPHGCAEPITAVWNHGTKSVNRFPALRQKPKGQAIMIKRISLACHYIVAIVFAAARLCAAAPVILPGFTHMRTVQDISEYRLDSNGLTVLLLPDHSAPAVTMMVTYRVGSRNE